MFEANSWMILLTLAQMTDVLEIGASFGGGSTAIFGRALKQKGRGEVWSLEAVPTKFKQARQEYWDGVPSYDHTNAPPPSLDSTT